MGLVNHTWYYTNASDVPRSLQSWVSTIQTVVLTADVFNILWKIEKNVSCEVGFGEYESFGWEPDWCGFGGSSSSFLFFRFAVHIYSCTGGRDPPRCTMWAWKSHCGDIEQCKTPLGVPKWEVVDTLWGVLHCSMSPPGVFLAHIVQGGGPSHLCTGKILSADPLALPDFCSNYHSLLEVSTSKCLAASFLVSPRSQTAFTSRFLILISSSDSAQMLTSSCKFWTS